MNEPLWNATQTTNAPAPKERVTASMIISWGIGAKKGTLSPARKAQIAKSISVKTLDALLGAKAESQEQSMKLISAIQACALLLRPDTAGGFDELAAKKLLASRPEATRVELLRNGITLPLSALAQKAPLFHAILTRDSARAEALCEAPGAGEAINQTLHEALLGRASNLDEGWMNYTPLHFACLRDDERGAKALLRVGANPNLYRGGVTCVGLCAYTGKAGVLSLFDAHGFDLRLELSPQHAPDNAGSTLLHRVMTRPIRGKAEVIIALAASERCYPELLCPDAQGRTPLSAVGHSGYIDPSAQALLRTLETARQERRLLTSSLPDTLPGAAVKPRL